MASFFARGPKLPLPPPFGVQLASMHERGAEPILSESLWRDQPAVVLVLRRPG